MFQINECTGVHPLNIYLWFVHDSGNVLYVPTVEKCKCLAVNGEREQSVLIQNKGWKRVSVPGENMNWSLDLLADITDESPIARRSWDMTLHPQRHINIPRNTHSDNTTLHEGKIWLFLLFLFCYCISRGFSVPLVALLFSLQAYIMKDIWICRNRKQ